MTKVLIYLTVSPVEKIIPVLVAKAIAGGARVWLRTQDIQESARWNTLFWTYSTATFLPHASEDLKLASSWIQRQPLWISSALDNANHATVVVNTTSEPFLEATSLEKIVEVLAPNSEDLAAKIGVYEAAPHFDVHLWQHNLNGSWEPVSSPIHEKAA